MRIVYSSGNRKSSIYRSILSIILGIVLIIWPNETADYMIIFIGAVIFIIGLISFSISIRMRDKIKREMAKTGDSTNWRNSPYANSLASVNGIGTMILGLILIIFAPVFVKIVMFLLGIILIIAALGQFVMLGAAKQLGHVAPVNYLFPVLIMLSGVVIIINPFKTVEGLFILFGATLIFYGITDSINQIRMHRFQKHNAEPGNINNKEHNGKDDIEDADYEEID
ncbi:MAG: HdeD family acid-resistance protein [Marinifilaceae bacterium]